MLRNVCGNKEFLPEITIDIDDWRKISGWEIVNKQQKKRKAHIIEKRIYRIYIHHFTQNLKYRHVGSARDQSGK